MLKKVNPHLKVNEKNSSLQANSSNTFINNSFLHEGYQPYNESTASRCFHCAAMGTAALMSVCDCNDRLFHQACLKQWIRARITSSRVSKTDDDNKSVKCDSCNYDIKFKQAQRCRCKNCGELLRYSSENKCFTTVIILFVILLLGIILCTMLLLVGTFGFNNDALTKSLIGLGLGGLGLVVSIGLICCCVECMRADDVVISTIFNRDGKSHRSNRSHRTNRSQNNQKSRTTLQVQPMD